MVLVSHMMVKTPYMLVPMITLLDTQIFIYLFKFNIYKIGEYQHYIE